MTEDTPEELLARLDESIDASIGRVIQDPAALRALGNYFKAHETLVKQLETTRKQFDKDNFVWRYTLLDALADFLQLGIGLPSRLIVPIQKMVGDELEKTTARIRREHPDKNIERTPSQKMWALALIAAYVTLLKEVGHAPTIGRALDEAAKVSGVNRDVIKNFRLNVIRQLYPPAIQTDYKEAIKRGRKLWCAEYMAHIHKELPEIGALVK